jgi:hypothetical protein
MDHHLAGDGLRAHRPDLLMHPASTPIVNIALTPDATWTTSKGPDGTQDLTCVTAGEGARNFPRAHHYRHERSPNPQL